MPCDIPPICEDPSTCNWCNPPMTEIDILKKKLEIAEKALKFIAAGEEEGHGPLEGCWAAQDALSKLSELDGE